MNATSRPQPGSRAAVLDSVVRAVSEGRYRMAQLQLQWHSDRAPLHEMAELITSATAMPHMPGGLDAEAVIASSRSALLPNWLEHHIDNEVHRIFSGQPTAGASPLQLVARVVAAVCIDVAAEKLDAAARAETSASATEQTPEADLDLRTGARDDLAADRAAPEAPAHRTRLIHLDAQATIDLEEASFADLGPVWPPPPR